ncbi:MAG: hypothetical protein AB7Q37_03310 [Pyrinomonadaceae bacterium]
MASGRSKSIGDSDRGLPLTVGEIVAYLSKPLHLPQFEVQFSIYRELIIESIQRLLEEAIREKILPSNVLGIQFVFAKTVERGAHRIKVEGDFSFPLLLHCRTKDEAKRISEGMAFVTSHLTRSDSSFHLRVRRFGLTYAPAVCVFSTFDPPSLHKVESASSTNLLWVTLPELQNNPTPFPDEAIEDFSESFNGRQFFQSDINKAILEQGFITNNLSESRLSAKTGSLQSSGTTDARKTSFRDMRDDLVRDSEYLSRVAYLLNYGDIILCTPHAYDELRPHRKHRRVLVNQGNHYHHDIITDTGLTVILDRNGGPIADDDWIRIQIVAQKLAIFVGATLSTASETKVMMMHTLNEGFNHEFRNAFNSISNRLERIQDKQDEGEKFSDADKIDIEGRLQFTQEFALSKMEVYKNEEKSLRDILFDILSPLKKYNDITITERIQADLHEHKVSTLWKPALIEILRNAYKNSPEGTACRTIEVSVAGDGQQFVVSVANAYKEEVVRNYALGRDPEGMEFVHGIANLLGGRISATVAGKRVTISIQIPLDYQRGIYV